MIIGKNVQDQAGYLLWNIKRRLTGGKWKSFVVGEFDKLEDYSTVNRTKRKIYGRND